MSQSFEKINNDQLIDIFENHDCLQLDCDICYEYMLRFNPDRLIQTGLLEDPMVDQFINDNSTEENDAFSWM